MNREARARPKGWLDPRLYGTITPTLRSVRALDIPSAVSLLVIGATLILVRHMVVGLSLAIISLATLAIGRSLPSLVRAVVGSGSDEELPVLMAALIPYVSSSRSLAQLMVELPRRLGLRYLSFESSRLRVMMATGLDERTALRSLIGTTPSRGLRDALRELLSAEEMGTSRSRLAAVLYRRTMESIRAAWAAYAKLSEAITEGLVSLIVSVGVFIPILAVGSGLAIAPLMAMALVAVPLSAVALALLRPRLGELEGGGCIMAVALASVVLSSLLLLRSLLLPSILVLLPGAVLGELSWARASRETKESLVKLREISERARLGLSFTDLLADVKLLGRKMVESMRYATGIAGVGKSGAALEAFADVISDAVITIRSMAAESYLLSILSAASPVLSIITIKVILSYLYNSPLLLESPLALTEALRLSIALAPLAPLPPMVMYRGRRVSTLPSLAAVLATLVVLRFLSI